MINFSQSEQFILTRRRRILQIISLVVGLVAFLALSYTTFSTVQALLANKASWTNNLSSELTSAATIIVAVIAYFLARKNDSRQVQVGSYLMTGVFAVVIFISLLIGSFNATTAAAFLLPMVCAGLLFSTKEIAWWLWGLVGLFTLAFILLLTDVVPNSIDDKGNATLITNYVCFLILLLLLGGGFWYLSINIRAILEEINKRVVELSELSQDRERKRQFGEEVSTRLKTMTSELSSTTIQQTSRSHQQATAVIEITTSLNELGETARQIATNARQVTQAAIQGLSQAQEVRQNSQRATTTAERGQTAVDSSIKAIEEVRNDITGLAERLMTLADRSRHIGSIIALIKEISDETHLLALNAAIESAGAGEAGVRFGVVAAEVKNLADRSLAATTEVSQIINELQGAVAGTVLASEETRKKTYGAVDRSYQAGQVITELGQVVNETASNSRQIVEVVQQVTGLAEEISLATQQQESAIQQVVGTMEGVGVVAQENASAVAQVSETISQIDTLSLQLKETLNSSRLVATA